MGQSFTSVAGNYVTTQPVLCLHGFTLGRTWREDEACEPSYVSERNSWPTFSSSSVQWCVPMPSMAWDYLLVFSLSLLFCFGYANVLGASIMLNLMVSWHQAEVELFYLWVRVSCLGSIFQTRPLEICEGIQSGESLQEHIYQPCNLHFQETF